MLVINAQEKKEQNEEIKKQIVENCIEDYSSYLSVIANSARVLVWVIDEEILNLLPQHVKNLVLDRLKTN